MEGTPYDVVDFLGVFSVPQGNKFRNYEIEKLRSYEVTNYEIDCELRSPLSVISERNAEYGILDSM